MKRYRYIWLTAWFLTAVAYADDTSTIVFSPEKITVDYNRLEVTCENYQPVAVGMKVTLAGRNYLVALKEDEKSDYLHYRSENSCPAGRFEAADIFLDRVTSALEETFYPITRATLSPAGFAPVMVTGELSYRDTRYARLVLFPVTVDSLGHLTFHREIKIYVGNRAVGVEQLLPESEVNISVPDRQNKASCQNSLSENVSYLIITCPALAASFAPLADYKNATGYRTRVITTDEVLSAYSGRDDAEKLREYLKVFHAQGGRYVLLGGDETNLPVRYAYHYRTDELLSTGQLQICDLYFADLTGEWDVDSDGVWGEQYDDNPDLEPELYVGRLPFSDTTEVMNYTDNLIRYETQPGSEDRSYLVRTFFFSSDQMRDYSGGGQHGRVATHFPGNFEIDTTGGVELASGNDPDPTNLLPEEVDDIVKEGFGIVNIIAHGRSDGFVVRSTGYNEWPKNYFLSAPQASGHGSLDSMLAPDKPSFYYSIACNTGAFDFDQPSYAHNTNMSQYLLSRKGGAVALIAQSRWGWVGSSYLLQQVFFDSLFAHPDRPAIEAMQASKRVYYYYRDLILGQNFYGDPSLKIYSAVPKKLDLLLDKTDERAMTVIVTSANLPVPDCRVIVVEDTTVAGDYLTDNDGRVTLVNSLDPEKIYTISALKTGFSVSQGKYVNLSLTDVDNQPELLPGSFSLSQNYPNPFNPSTVITFELSFRQHVNLSIYNILGQKVSTLIDEELAFGKHNITWFGLNDRGGQVAAGIYFYRLSTSAYNQTRKMVLLR
ncbi:MAG: C25 family cysteine peptidase [candidate division Zixibacteria bacterium]|nr:C25 family cysteine peptidase [candidate division Zixibacteria bacterium]